MKRNYLYKNTGRFLLATGVLVATLLSSCLKDNSPGTINFGKSPALLGFQYAGFNATPYVVAILPDPGVKYNAVEVTLSVASLTLKSAVTATLAIDEAGENAFIASDTAGGKVDHVLPASDYTVPTSITIPAGTQTVVVPFVFAADKIDFTQNYILGFKLTNVSGATLATNLSNAIMEIVLKSAYQATYNVNGFVFRNIGGGVNDPSLGGNFTGASQSLATVTAFQVTWAPLWANGSEAGGVGGTTLTVDPSTNLVTVSSTGNPTLTNNAGYNNHYDPATKTFYISYNWNAGARNETDTLTYTGP